MDCMVHIDFGRSDRIFDNRSVICFEFELRTIIDVCHQDGNFHFVVEIWILKIAIGIPRCILNPQSKLICTLRFIIKNNTRFRFNGTILSHIKNIGITANGRY